jgi:O-acetyl-ADP-ribose deacetylase (regulator of RNase III)
MQDTMASKLPHITLLFMQPSASTAFTSALLKHKLALTPSDYTIHNTYLSDLPPDLHFDLVVSPANSYAILDGGFDDAISRAFSPKDDYGALTRAAQRELYKVNRGYLPPGQCLIVELPGEWREQRKLRYHDGKGWGCRYLALCPTMRMPSLCDWDKEVVYECIWSLLTAIERHNQAASAGEKIESLLMTPLGTGTGGISVEKWASQTVLAMKHFVEAAENPDRHAARDWADLARVHAELSTTNSS